MKTLKSLMFGALLCVLAFSLTMFTSCDDDDDDDDGPSVVFDDKTSNFEIVVYDNNAVEAFKWKDDARGAKVGIGTAEFTKANEADTDYATVKFTVTKMADNTGALKDVVTEGNVNVSSPVAIEKAEGKTVYTFATGSASTIETFIDSLEIKQDSTDDDSSKDEEEVAKTLTAEADPTSVTLSGSDDGTVTLSAKLDGTATTNVTFDLAEADTDTDNAATISGSTLTIPNAHAAGSVKVKAVGKDGTDTADLESDPITITITAATGA